MEGLLIVGERQDPVDEAGSVALDPADIPGPIGDRAPENVNVDLEAVEVRGRLADGTTYA